MVVPSVFFHVRIKSLTALTTVEDLIEEIIGEEIVSEQ